MNNENILNPERKSLLVFLNEIKNTQFVIPVYQRNYIWQENKQIKKFLDDYELLLKGSKDSHFIGIIMFLIIQITLSKTEFSVVDGQQRLITIFLFLQALREVANETGDVEFAEKILNKYLINETITEEVFEKLKLKPLVADNNVYSKIILNKSNEITQEEKRTNIYRNYICIKQRIKEWFGSYPLEDLLYALDKFYFVVL